MPKRRFTEDSWRKEPWFKALAQSLLMNKTEEDMGNFLRDIATLSELQAWSERLEVAKQLARGLTYREVAKNTGASTTTVTRVAKFLENGEGGYRKVLRTHRHHRMKPDIRREDAPEIKELPTQQSTQVPTQKSILQKYL